MKKKVVLIGGYKMTKFLAKSLVIKGYKVLAINDNKQDCYALAEIDGLEVFFGDGTKPFVLENAGIDYADIAIALTNLDEDNLVICELCKKKFFVKKTVSIVSEPIKIDFFHRMGVDSAVCAITTITNIIEQQAFLCELASLVPIGEGRINIAQVHISSESPVINKKIYQLKLPKEVIIGCILRGEQNMIPHGGTMIFIGDTLILISSNNQEIEAIRKLTGKW